MVVADVEYAVWCVASGRVWVSSIKRWAGRSGFVEDADYSFHNVINVGEVAHHLAVVEDVNGPLFQNGLGKQEQRHVGTTPRAIDREETQTSGREAKQVAVGVGHQFIGLLRGGVQANGVVYVVVFAKRQGGVATVHARAAGIGQMLHTVVSAPLQNIGEALQIGVYIGVRVGKRVAHSGLGSQVDDSLGLLTRKQLGHTIAVFYAELVEAEVRVACKAR